MKRYILTLIIQNKSDRKARQLGKHIKELIGADSLEFERYFKFPDAFILHYQGEIEDRTNSINHAVQLTGMLCGPWQIELKAGTGEPELTFNKTDHSKFPKPIFNTIIWGNFVYEEREFEIKTEEFRTGS